MNPRENLIISLLVIVLFLIKENSEKLDILTPLPLSHDHKPELEKERNRIISCGGKVDKFTGNISFFIILKVY